MSKYVVKFGDLYSLGLPASLANKDKLQETMDGGLADMGLALSHVASEAHVFTDREFATKHAVAWTPAAIAAERPIPRVVKRKDKSSGTVH